QRAIGSGFVIDPRGYIVTNAHVVKGAQRVQVVLPSANADGSLDAALSTRTIVIPARIVGVSSEIDLALIKVDVEKLPALALGTYRKLGQGEIVFAFGSPGGLRNTVTMGVISAVARQTEPDSPMVYIQTDAPINPGNSGGPLVNVNGEVVGVNTFILSQSGGNEGLGFAIPSNVVNVAFRQLRKFGHLHRAEIGIGIQTITPNMAAALSLARTYGGIVSDVMPGSTAEAADLRSPFGIIVAARSAGAGVEVPLNAGDVIRTLNGQPMTTLDRLRSALKALPPGAPVVLQIQRDQKLLFISFALDQP